MTTEFVADTTSDDFAWMARSTWGIVTFLIWVWLTNIAALLGIELDSEIERGRELSIHQPGPPTAYSYHCAKNDRALRTERADCS